jgi:hypothetical protein
MTVEEMKVIRTLEEQMNEVGFESIIKEIDGLEVLRVLLDELGENGNGNEIIEFCFLPVGDDNGELPTDLRLFQIYTTILGDIPEEKFSDILTKLNKKNLECVLGGFSIYEKEHQLYHKYISVVRGNTAEEMLDIIQPAVNWISATVVEMYDEMVSLCN